MVVTITLLLDYKLALYILLDKNNNMFDKFYCSFCRVVDGSFRDTQIPDQDRIRI